MLSKVLTNQKMIWTAWKYEVGILGSFWNFLYLCPSLVQDFSKIGCPCPRILIKRISISGWYVESNGFLHNIASVTCCLFCLYGWMLDFISTKQTSNWSRSYWIFTSSSSLFLILVITRGFYVNFGKKDIRKWNFEFLKKKTWLSWSRLNPCQTELYYIYLNL